MSLNVGDKVKVVTNVYYRTVAFEGIYKITRISKDFVYLDCETALPFHPWELKLVENKIRGKRIIKSRRTYGRFK